MKDFAHGWGHYSQQEARRRHPARLAVYKLEQVMESPLPDRTLTVIENVALALVDVARSSPGDRKDRLRALGALLGELE